MMRAFICGCEGPALTGDEASFLAEAQPWGLILFRRNVETPDQLRALTASFREAVGRAEAPVLVDQEGGRVQRLRPPHWPSYPAAAAYGALAERDREEGRQAATLGGRLVAADLAEAGITIDCAPVLDRPVAGSSDVVGDRAFAPDGERIAILARAFAEGLLAGGVLPVVKHMPGHGRAAVDSHHLLPMVDAPLEDLEADFEPFRRLADLPIGMTAHVVYAAIDRARPGTVSTAVIRDVIRGRIGFDGLLLSDDLSMQALEGTIEARAGAALEAGCDIALHCNGVLEEARRVASVAPFLAGTAAIRARSALDRRRPSAVGKEDRREALANLRERLGLAA